MTNWRHLVMVSLFLVIGGCSNFHEFEDVTLLDEVQAVGSPFTQKLTSEYRDFVHHEIDAMHDHADGLHFARKGAAASKGYVVMPEPVSDWNLIPSDRHELATARGRLIRVFEYGARELRPEISAIAQARFDCWIEQEEENWQSSDIAKCKSEFFEALATLEADIKRPEPPKPVAPVQQPPAAPAPLVESPLDVDPTQPMRVENALYLVFFDFNKSNLNQGALSVIDAVANEIRSRSLNRVNIVGHADTVGSNRYNENLALKRANVVRSALITRGIAPNILRVESRGETDPMVPTADNVREPANRRAEISFE